MNQPYRRSAGIAALLIFLAFLTHAVNALYVEPNILGFRNPATDYAKIDLLKNALGSFYWTLSGIGHLVSGFAMVYLARAAGLLMGEQHGGSAEIARMGGLIGGIGFLLTGISDLVGGGLFGSPFGAVKLLSAQNPDLEGAAYLSQSLARINYNSLAQVGLGWYAVLLSRGSLRSRTLPRAFGYFGYFSGVCGLVMGVMFVPLYLYTVLVWSLWLSVLLLRPTGVPARA